MGGLPENSLSSSNKKPPNIAGSQTTSMLKRKVLLREPCNRRVAVYTAESGVIAVLLDRKERIPASSTKMETGEERGGEKDNFDRKFNVASHMGHISSVLYSFCLCVCVREFQSKSPGAFEGMQSWRHVLPS